MESSDIETQVAEFATALEGLENVIKVIDLDTIAETEGKVPDGYYVAMLFCDNCTSDVHLFIRKGFKVPRMLEGETCPNCRTVGHIYKPITEKDMIDFQRKRGGGPDESMA